MNDFDYDVMQKKRLARNAIYKKNGSKSRKCTLPQDHMSAAELKRRNGEMATYNISRPMKWDKFKEMPNDLKMDYVKKLRDFYNESDARIAEMLCVTPATVSTYFGEHGLRDGVVRKMSARQKASWERFLKMADSEEETEHINVQGCVDDDVTDTEVCTEEVVKVLDKKIPMMSCKLVMTGDVYGVCKRVVEILGADAVGEITVYFNAKEKLHEEE